MELLKPLDLVEQQREKTAIELDEQLQALHKLENRRTRRNSHHTQIKTPKKSLDLQPLHIIKEEGEMLTELQRQERIQVYIENGKNIINNM